MPVSRSAYSTRQRLVVLLLAGVVPLVIGVVGVVIIVGWLPELPASIATHWNGAGQVDGFADFWGVVATMIGLTLVLGGVFTLAAMSLTDDAAPARGRLMVAASVAVTTAITTGVVASVGLQRGDAAVPTVMQVGQWLLIGLGFGAVLGAVAFLLAPKSVQHDPDDLPDVEPIELSPEERAVWTGVAAPSKHFAVLYAGLVLLMLGVSVAAAIQEPAAIAVIAVPVILLLSATVLGWRVTVSRNGLVARGALGLPRFVIPLADIADVRLVRVDAFSEFGGWGLRWGAGRTGIILRSGEAIEIRRTHGRALVVTVPDAATGAALLDGFLARSRA